MKLKANKKVMILSLSLIIAAVFLLVNPARAGWGNDILAGIISAIVSALGKILIMLMGILVSFAQYNSFIQSSVVINGWVIVRDVCNMFFVLILLIIAFATILRIEEYSYKKWLPKLILMAILINFSKTICGLLIDAAQIIMLTFVNSFKDVAGANLTTALGISKWQSLGNDIGNSSLDWEVTAGLLLALIYVIISIVVIGAMVAMIAMRIVMLWIYVVLSPAAYLMSAFPAGKKYAGQWWSQFTQNLIVGPVLAFFIWLSFTSLATFNSADFATPDLTSGGVQSSANYNTYCADPNHKNTPGCGSSGVLIQFIVAIGLLLGGLKITQEIGGVAASAAGAGMSRINKMGKATVRGVGGAVGAVTGYNFAKRKYGEFQKRTKEKIEAKSDLAYETVKGKVKGGVKGVTNVAGLGLGAAGRKIKQAASWADEKTGGKVGAVAGKVGQKFEKGSAWYQRRLERKKENERRYEAHEGGVYKDKDKNEFNFNPGTKQYERTVTAESKTLKDAYGNPLKTTNTEVAKGVDSKPIEKMSDASFRFRAGFNDGTNKSQGVRNELQEKKQGEQQKILEASGVSTTELKRIMNDSAVNKNRRLAAAMTLAIKNGFKNNNHAAGRQDVTNAKALIGNNEVVLKKFNEAVNKSSAHLNHNLENDAGKESFKKEMDDGKFDGYNLDKSAYTSPDLVETLKSYSGFDFADNISRVSSKSAQHRNNVTDGLVGAKDKDLADGAGIYDEKNGKINAYAQLIGRLSGDMKKAFTDLDGNFSDVAATKFMDIAKPSWLGNFDSDQLRRNGDPDHDGLVDKIVAAITKGMKVNTIASLEKTGSNPQLVRRMVAAVNHDIGKEAEVKKTNILRTVTPLEPNES